MIIVRIFAGLGNQMFQYDLYRALQVKGIETKLDLREFRYYQHHFGYELNRIFNIKESIATDRECNLLSNYDDDLLTRVIRKLIYRGFRRNKKTHLYDPQNQILNVFDMDNVYLDGYWQSEYYFNDIKDLLRDEFTFKLEMNNENKNIISQINNTNSVSIHVRRGDYLQTPLFNGACTLEYYRNALDYMDNNIQEPWYFIFSDDIEWCKNNIKHPRSVYVDINRDYQSFNDMRLMSICKHNIIANSSFSWWSSWLIQNKQKIVICPKKWVNDGTTNFLGDIKFLWQSQEKEVNR